MVGSTPVGAIQPEEEAAVPWSASWQYTSRRTGSTGRDSKGRAKRATWLPIHLVRGVGARVRSCCPIFLTTFIRWTRATRGSCWGKKRICVNLFVCSYKFPPFIICNMSIIRAPRISSYLHNWHDRRFRRRCKRHRGFFCFSRSRSQWLRLRGVLQTPQGRYKCILYL